MSRTIIILGLAMLCAAVSPSLADEVTIIQNGTTQNLIGEILVETQDGQGVLFQTCDGKLWPIQQGQLKSKTTGEETTKPFKKKDFANQLKNELGDGFRIHQAGNFVIAYNTEVSYARWVAGLYRKLERGFDFYWSRNKFKLQDRPDFPLPVIIFKSQLEYERYMKKDIGLVNSMMAYYNLKTNRVVMYDLTADEVPPGAELNARAINEVLGDPRAIPMVATIIHEGTHQLMFNYGMQTRLSDTPLWINEGLAMYFETPDLSADRGWRTIGKVNFHRLRRFLQYLQSRPEGALKAMLQSDEGFRNDKMLDNYAQAWAFNYFLLNRHKKSYVKYLKHISQKPALMVDTPEQRINEFLEHFDDSLEELDAEFVRYIRKLN